VNEADVVLDTSAIFALVRDEPGAETVERLLDDGRAGKKTIAVSFATLTELFYNTLRLTDVSYAHEMLSRIKSWPLEFVYPDERLCLAAGELKVLFRVSFADAFIAATAREANAVLVHKDPEFESLHEAVKLKPLPYRRDR
jgi:predicted nucleic acid-binding protein